MKKNEGPLLDGLRGVLTGIEYKLVERRELYFFLRLPGTKVMVELWEHEMFLFPPVRVRFFQRNGEHKVWRIDLTAPSLFDVSLRMTDVTPLLEANEDLLDRRGYVKGYEGDLLKGHDLPPSLVSNTHGIMTTQKWLSLDPLHSDVLLHYWFKEGRVTNMTIKSWPWSRIGK